MFTRYKIIRSFKELKQLVEACLNTGYASVDFETNAEGIYKDTFKPTILSVSFQVGSGCSIPLQHFDESVKDIPWLKWLQYFGRKVVENPKVVKVAQNFKFDNQIFVKYGIYVRGTVIDTMLAKYLLNEEKPHGLKPMVAKYLPEFADYEKYDKFETIPWDKKPLEPLARYGCMDTDFTLRLALFLEKKLIDKGFYNLYRNLIMPASKVLQDAETNGLPIDLSFNDFLQDKYSKLIQETNDKLRSVRQIKRYQKYSLEQRKKDYIDKLTQEIEELSGDPKKAKSIKNREEKISRVLAGEYKTNDEKKLIEPINFNSTKQMVDLLYLSPKGFKFPVIEYTKDKKNKPTSNPSTSEDTLLKILDQDKSGFIKALLDLRGLDKMNSTYIVGLRELVQSDNKVHPTFLISGTTSGRLSSRNPNGQNIPKVMVNPDIKKQFIPPPGKLFLTYDYSQAELRILAHLAKEETMLEWFRTGKDIHLASACKKYHEDYDTILKIYEDEQHELYPLWKKRRKQAKCYSPDTEILTPSGWQRLDSYDGKSLVAQYNFDTEEISFVKPENYGKVLSKNNYIYKDRNISLDITNEHKTLFITRHGKKIKDDFKNLVGRNGYMPVAGFLKREYPISDDMTRFIAMFISDGNYNGDGKIRFGFKKLRKIKRCKYILNKLNISYTNPREGKFYIPLNGNEFLYEALAKVSDNKTLKWNILDKCNGDIYLQEAANWDGHINNFNYVSFSTIIKDTATIMQVMGHLNGYMVSLRDKGRKYVLGYSLRKKSRARVNLKNAKPYKVNRGKEMWSVTVPSRNLVVRKDNKVVLSGNTLNFGVCFSGDTEILTEKGWQRFDVLDKTLKVAQYNQDTTQISFVTPQKYIEYQDQELWLHESKCTNICATSNHRLLFKKLKYRPYNEITVGEVNGLKGYSPSAGLYKGNYIDDRYTRLIAIIASDGNFFRPGRFRFCFKKERKIERFEWLLNNQLNIKYTKRVTKRYTTFHIDLRGTEYDGIVEKYLSPNKDLSIDAIHDLNGGVYLDEAFNWDGTQIYKTHSKVYKFSTKSETTANIMQIFGILNNKRITLTKIRNLYRIHWRESEHSETYVNWSFNKVPNKQSVYCVQVPDSNIIVRRNGRVLITKNCYEQTAVNLSKTLETSQEEAQKFLDEFFDTFPKIKKFMDKQHKFMEKHGYCVSLFGRRRRCPKVYSDNYGEYLEALRQSTNAPVQSAASDMALFASIIVWEQIKKGELPPMKEVNTVHDSVYQFIEPRYITPDTVYKLWDICRNPSTKEFFGFEIKDVNMSMDFTVGRTMAEELPYIPGYDYNKMLSSDFDIDEYYSEHKKVMDIPIEKYPKKFKSYFEESWRKR